MMKRFFFDLAGEFPAQDVLWHRCSSRREAKVHALFIVRRIGAEKPWFAKPGNYIRVRDEKGRENLRGSAGAQGFMSSGPSAPCANSPAEGNRQRGADRPETVLRPAEGIDRQVWRRQPTLCGLRAVSGVAPWFSCGNGALGETRSCRRMANAHRRWNGDPSGNAAGAVLFQMPASQRKPGQPGRANRSTVR